MPYLFREENTNLKSLKFNLSLEFQWKFNKISIIFLKKTVSVLFHSCAYLLYHPHCWYFSSENKMGDAPFYFSISEEWEIGLVFIKTNKTSSTIYQWIRIALNRFSLAEKYELFDIVDCIFVINMTAWLLCACTSIGSRTKSYHVAKGDSICQ